MATKNIGQYSSPTLPLADDDLIAGAQINASGQGTDVKIKKKDLLLGMLGFAGTYAANVTYALGNVVYYSGSGYVCVATSVIGVIPGTNSAKWAILVSKGDAGALTAEYEAILNQAIATWNGAVDTTTQNVATATAQANVATNSANVAATSAASLQAALASFRAVYIGSLPSDPSADGNGNPLVEGAEYYNTTENKLRIWNGSAWVDYDSSVQTLTQNATLSAAAAANSATQAVNAAADVAAAESNVTNLANQTQTNADSAANSATTATAAATSAANSATAASGSAADAAAVVTTVQAAASDAAASASNADASATTASNNAAAASASALSAAGSATSASNSASTASAAASSVGDSATQAAASATAAANSASNAAASAATISQFRTVYNLSAAAAGQSTYSVSGGYLIGLIDVYLNGFHLTNTVHYDALDGANVVLKGSDVLATVTAGSQISISALTTYAVANAVPISSLAGSAGAGMVGYSGTGSTVAGALNNLQNNTDATLGSTLLGHIDNRYTGAVPVTVRDIANVVNVKYYGIVPGSADNYTNLQNLITNMASVSKGGLAVFPELAKYKTSPISLGYGVVLSGPTQNSTPGYLPSSNILRATLAAVSTGALVTASQTCSGAINLDFQGLSKTDGTLDQGFITSTTANRVVLENCNFNGFGDEAIWMQGVGCYVSKVLVINSLLSRTRTARTGAMRIEGTDSFVDKFECNTSLTGIFSSNLYLCAVYIGGANHFIGMGVGEISEIGVFVTGSGTRSTLSMTRADRNWGHGFAGAGFFVGCKAADNSQAGDGLYSGFTTLGASGAVWDSCLASSIVTNRHLYGFDASGSEFTSLGQRANGTGNRSFGHMTATLNNTSTNPAIWDVPRGSMRQTGATPNMDGHTGHYPTDSSAVTITDFLNCVDGNEYFVVPNTVTTIQNNSSIVTGTGADLAPSSTKIYRFMYVNGKKYFYPT